MSIPNAKIRRAYINALPQYRIYDISVPNDEVPPNLHLTVNNVVLKEHEEYKGGNEWMTAINVDIWNVNEKGFVSSFELEEVANDIIKAQPIVKDFKIQNIKMFNCQQFNPVETDTNTIERMVVTLQIWTTYEG